MDVTTVLNSKPNPNIPELSPGDTVKVRARIGEKHTQLFNGVVIKVRRGADGGNFTIRRVTHGIGVEHTFPFASPLLEKVEVVRRGKVRRARLYYIRRLSAKEARLKERRERMTEKAAAEAVVEEGVAGESVAAE